MEPGNLMEQLCNFSATFLIDDDISERVRRLIHTCISETFQIKFYHIMLDGKQVSGKPGLATPKIAGQAWCNDDADSVPIYSSDNTTSYRAQSTYAYQEQKPLWITSKDGKPLHESDEYIDYWSFTHENETKELPKFRNPDKREIKTSVIIPLRHGEGHVFGFICLESREHIKGNNKLSQCAKQEFNKLANSIGAILSAHENYLNRQNSTRNALERLEKLAQDYKFACPLSKPIVFFASSSQADPEAVSVIRTVLNEFADEIEVKDWREDQSTGYIPGHIKETISDCRFGICYFSEPAKEEDHSKYNYIDNPNVMFEAGMLNSLVYSLTAAPKGWIPIREEESPPAPFDFAQERMINIKRLNDRKINKDKLITDLKDRLQELLKT